MNALLDAHTLLWFLAGSKKLSAVALQFIQDRQNTLFVSPAVLWEISARPRFVPEARKILAGGEAQRNHRTKRPTRRCAPAGRENRETPPTPLDSAAVHRAPDFLACSRPAGAPGRVVALRGGSSRSAPCTTG